MAAFEYVNNVYDPALKPRLLRSLIKEHIPDEKQQLRNSLQLSHLVSAVKTHELLSERQSNDDKKMAEKWKSAVDFWVDRLLMLLSSNMVYYIAYYLYGIAYLISAYISYGSIFWLILRMS